MTSANFYCGFADVQVHYEANSIGDLRIYNELVSDLGCLAMLVEEVNWRKNRVRLKSYLSKKANFTGGKNGQVGYLSAFSTEKWLSLPIQKRRCHSYKNCPECIKHHPQFTLKKANNTLKDNTSNNHETPVMTNMQRWNEATPPKKLQPRITSINEVPKSIQRQIVQQYLRKHAELSARRQLLACYSSNSSLRQWDDVRRKHYGFYSTRRRHRTHIGPLDSYVFDRKLARSKLMAISDSNMDLGNQMKGKWTKLAQEVKVNSKRGTPCHLLNGAQVMMAYARSLGLTFATCIKTRQRFSRMRVDGVLWRPSKSSKDLRKERDALIAQGKIDVGLPICPVASVKFVYDKMTNGIIEQQDVFTGRKLSLTDIRLHHLQLMDKQGLLRKTDIASLTVAEAVELLSRCKGVVWSPNDTLEDMKAKVNLLQTHREMVFWHDHADLKGKSCFQVTVSFMYNAAMYKTAEELGYVLASSALIYMYMFDVQGIVEQPFLHIIGFSNSTIADQQMYAEARLEEIASLHPLSYKGVEYTDIARFHTGDLPARQFEGGQAIGGQFPCLCGVEISRCGKMGNTLNRGPFYSLDQRIKFLKSKGYDIESLDVNKMKKAELEAAAMKIACNLTYDETPDQLRKLLRKEMRGVRRLPSLAIAMDSLELNAKNLGSIEIALCEPLHDLKNVIQSILEDLPAIVTSKVLRDIIKSRCTAALGQKKQMRGCDARRALITLTLELSDFKFRTDEQCDKVYQMLLALTEVQRLAYLHSTDRCQKEVLRMYLNALVFACLYAELFRENGRYNTPLHCVSVHFAEMFRFVSLRSLVAEASERTFHDLRLMSKASNNHPSNIILNVMVRNHFKREAIMDSVQMTNSYERTENAISTAGRALDSKHRTILRRSFINRHKTQVLQTFKWIADYIIQGPGVWYNEFDGHIEFLDGSKDEETQGDTLLLNHREHNAENSNAYLENKWRSCLVEHERLRLPLITALTSSAGDSQQHVPCTSVNEDAEPTVNEPLKFDDTPESSSVDNQAMDTTESALIQQPAAHSTPQPSTSLVIVTPKVSKTETRYEPRSKQEITQQPDSNGHTSANAQVPYTTKEEALISIWRSQNLNTKDIKLFISQRQNRASAVAKLQYKATARRIEPKLMLIKHSATSKLKDLERKYYVEHKQLSVKSLDKELDKVIKICNHFLGSM